MYGCVLGFLLGVLLINWLPELPSSAYFLSAVIIILTALPWLPKKYRYYFAFLLTLNLGSYYTILRAQHILSWQLPGILENNTVVIRGVVSSLPESDTQQTRFEMRLQTLNGIPQHTKLRLSWYHTPPPAVIIGETWQLQVRLKRAHGLLNPGGFDYEQWLFSRGIRATGYVLSGTRLQASSALHDAIDRLRQSLQQRIEQELAGIKTSGLIVALIVGVQTGINPEQWQVMRATGTNHLMAIAGVHICFIGGFAYLIVHVIWRRFTRLMLWLPACQAAALATLLAAIIYSALAGFALPTQRALLMLSILMLGLLTRRRLRVGNSLALAMIVILCINPFTILTVSFWLSFSAVLAILVGTYGRLRTEGLWWKYGRVQWVITLGLIPLSLWLFQQTSLVSFLANLIAVPAVGLLVLPLCGLGVLLLYVYAALGQWLLGLAAHLMALIFGLLTLLAHSRGAVWQQVIVQPWLMMTTVVGVTLLIAPRGLLNRWLGCFWLLPIVFYRAPVPATGELWLTLLDVGQGLAAVVRTSHHTLIFDTGPPMGSEDAGQRVIQPFLQAAGIHNIDLLMISHGDSDHIGGAYSLLQNNPIKQIMTSVPQRFPHWPARLCLAGQSWQWDGVIFQVLYPTSTMLGLNNNSSCVLRVSIGRQALLFTGDIEKTAEAFLVQHQPQGLAATVLIAPHHGSRTSSSPEFVNAVNPRYVLFPVGYKNRYHFPNVSILERYQQAHSQTWISAETGAISLVLSARLPFIQVKSQRQADKKIYHDF